MNKCDDQGDVPSELELIQEWRDKKCSDAAAQLHALYLGRLIARVNANIAPNLRGNVSADSIVNSAFGSVFRGTANGEFQFDRDEDFWRLLISVALNKLRRRLRKKRPDTLEDPDLLPALNTLHGDPSPDEVAVFRELRETLLRALNEREREYFLLREGGGLLTEIAVLMNVSERQVRRYARAVEQRAFLIFGAELSKADRGPNPSRRDR